MTNIGGRLLLSKLHQRVPASVGLLKWCARPRISSRHPGFTSSRGHIDRRMYSTSNTEVEPLVLFETVNGDKTGVITLNRPKALNSLTLPMIQQIRSKLLEWQSKVSFVVVRSNIDKAFCAGGDVVAVTEAAKKGNKVGLGFFSEEYQMNYLIATYKVPQVALIHGITMGGGIGLSFYGRYRVATEKTMIAMPETLIGLFTDIGGTYFLPRIPRNVGIYLGLTGQRLVGYDVVRAGIATHFCDADKLEELRKELLATKDASQLDALLRNYMEQSVHAKTEVSFLEPNMDKIERLFSSEKIEGIFDALEKDGSEWALKQRQTLTRMSPTSLKLTMRLFKVARDSDLRKTLMREYSVMQHVLAKKDFYEGVRALLVDKDNKPSWNPSRIEDVGDDYIESYLEPSVLQLKI